MASDVNGFAKWWLVTAGEITLINGYWHTVVGKKLIIIYSFGQWLVIKLNEGEVTVND